MSSFFRFLIQSWMPTLILMFLQRVLFWYQLHHFSLAQLTPTEFFWGLVTGFRFDWMLAGYTGLLFFPLARRPSTHRIEGWLHILWLQLSAVLFAAEMVFFSLYLDRWKAPLGLKGIELVTQILFEPVFWWSWILQFPALFLMILWIVRSRFQKNSASSLQKIKGGEWLAFIFLSLVAIRGSFGSHHLDLRHSHFSGHTWIDMGALNSWYALDQALRMRR